MKPLEGNIADISEIWENISVVNRNELHGSRCSVFAHQQIAQMAIQVHQTHIQDADAVNLVDREKGRAHVLRGRQTAHDEQEAYEKAGEGKATRKKTKDQSELKDIASGVFPLLHTKMLRHQKEKTNKKSTQRKRQ